MVVGNPQVFWWLLILLPCIVVSAISYWNGVQQRRSLNWWNKEERVSYQVKSFFQSLLLLLIVASSIFSFAGVSWGYTTVEDDRRGVDVSFVVDLSNSMMVEDITPNRLFQVGVAIRSLIQSFDSLWFSLVVFKGNAVQLLPMTQDEEALERILATLHPSIFTSTGTDIEAGILRSIDSFPTQSNRHAVMILFSDGEALSGHALQAASQASKQGVTIFTVVSAREEGGMVIVGGEAILDESGLPVISRPDTQLLKNIAQQTGGKSVSLTDTTAIAAITQEIQNIVSRQDIQGTRQVQTSRHRVFIAIILISLIAVVILEILL